MSEKKTTSSGSAASGKKHESGSTGSNGAPDPRDLIARVARVASEREVPVYAVGGYVRDRLLCLPFSGEIDFSVVGDGPAFAKAVASAFGRKGKVQIYRRFGTAQVMARGVRLEFATSRRESYSRDSRNPEVELAPFEEDLARRDFTVNAMAVPVADPDEIIDPYDGRGDLERGIIRTPLDPERTFNDDPLRILRAIRFASRLGFSVADGTWEALKKQRTRLEIVARERINDEFFKILAHNPPSRGLMMLHESGVLEVIFPEIAALSGVEQVGRHHHKDVLLHTLKVVDKVAERTDRVDLRFAALVHDIGKPRTKEFDPGEGWTFHGHEHVGARMIAKMGRRYKLGDELTERTRRLVHLHMRPINLQDEEVTDSGVRRLMVQAGDQLDDLLLVCRADITSGNPKKVRRYLKAFDQMVERMNEVEQKDRLRAFQSPIRGDEIMERTGLPEGPRVGLIKALIEEAILEGDIPNSREGAEAIFEDVVERVRRMEDDRVIPRLREIMRARQEGTAPAPDGEDARD